MYYITIDQYPTRRTFIEQECEYMERCHIDGEYYYPSEIVYDKEFSFWVAKINIDYYCDSISDLTNEERENLRNNLKQL